MEKGQDSIMRSLLLALLVGLRLLGGEAPLSAQEKSNKLGIIVGQWQPNSMRTEKPVSVFKGTADSSPFLALNYDRSLTATVSAHFSAGYWSHLFTEDTARTVILLPMELGIEHNLIDHSPISPYVLYGIEFLIGKVEKGDFLRKWGGGHFNRNRFGFFLLTGIRFTLFQTVEFDLNFGYIYAKFSRNLGPIRDFTGLRATFGLNYLF